MLSHENIPSLIRCFSRRSWPLGQRKSKPDATQREARAVDGVRVPMRIAAQAAFSVYMNSHLPSHLLFTVPPVWKVCPLPHLIIIPTSSWILVISSKRFKPFANVKAFAKFQARKKSLQNKTNCSRCFSLTQ